MVEVSLNGRLGNQLFQYAFAFALSQKFKTPYLINDSKYQDSFLKYFEPISIYDNKWVKKVIRRIASGKKFNSITQTGFEPIHDIIKQIKNNHKYDGYFQSFEFFLEASQLLKKKLRIKTEFQQSFISKYGHLFKDKKVLCIHYRLGDYITWNVEQLGGSNLVLPDEFYEESLKRIEDLDQYKVIVVTDDKENIKNKLQTIKEKIIISDSEISDFQMMMHADTLIISNSTFAWWAAFLNVKNAKVYAPEYWIGFKVKKEYPSGILPSRFTKVSFN